MSRVEEGDAVVERDALDGLERGGQCLRERIGPLAGEELVRAHHVDERGCHQTVLGLGSAREQMLPNRHGNARGQIESLHPFDRLAALGGDLRPAAEQDRRLLLPAEVARVERRRGLGADRDLAGVGEALHRDRTRRRRPGDDELPVQVADEEEVEDAAVDADRHAKRDRSRVRADASDTTHGALHLESGPAGPPFVLVAVEEQEHGVAAPLDHPGAELVCAREALGETLVEDLVHLLGPDLASAGEPLRQVGEARDVDERERALDPPVDALGRLSDPLDDETRDVRLEPRGRRCGRRRGGGHGMESSTRAPGERGESTR